MPAKTNLLSQSTSPYLLQHASNPVHWQPWGKQALAQADRENRPILLSIGYSACHWCHVMAHESFEDPNIAQIMNELFIAIKVDREERPDLDKIYQSAHNFLTGRGGGWPLTMFLSPASQTPFFGGTYFPPTKRHGLPAFGDLMRQVEAFFRQNQNKIEQQNHALLEALAAMTPVLASEQTILNQAPLHSARQQLEQNFDRNHGGFGQAPKFPHPSNIERLLRHWATASKQTDQGALAMAITTLHNMAEGGINDHLGGGFCRYSVDNSWMIPHFEKMLYDNGPLLALYADAWQITKQTVFQDAAHGIATWTLREMQSEEGGYYSSLDADSEGEEGRFYYWDPKQVRDLLNDQEWPLFAHRYGLDRPPNFDGQYWHLHGFVSIEMLYQNKDPAQPGVHSHPQTPTSLTENSVTRSSRSATIPVVSPLAVNNGPKTSEHVNLRLVAPTKEEIGPLLDSARNKLFQAREQRVHPGRDDKILTAWNALMIKGMVRAGRRLEKPEYIASAARALGYIQQYLWRKGRLLATARAGHAHLPAYLDDYAYLADAVLELLQSQWQDQWLTLAIDLADALVTHFEDPKQGGFFFTAHDHESLIHRPKPFSDEATPSGNGVAAKILILLGHLLGESRYVEAAERTLRLAWPALLEMPYAHASLLDALETTLQPPELIIIRGQKEAMAPWLKVCHAIFRPTLACFAIPVEAKNLPTALEIRVAGPTVRAYYCKGTQCSNPLNTLVELKKKLKQ